MTAGRYQQDPLPNEEYPVNLRKGRIKELHKTERDMIFELTANTNLEPHEFHFGKGYKMFLEAKHMDLLREIFAEIDRGNVKHGAAPLAIPIEVVAILTEEVGEYAQAVLKHQNGQSRKELIQVAAVAINHLLGTGPHCSQL